MKISTKYIKPEGSSSVRVIIEDLRSHPCCPHGPTLLFARQNGRQFYACSACRDRKLCNFFLWADEKDKVSNLKLEAWKSERVKFLKGVNHRKQFLVLNEIKSMPLHQRTFCTNCHVFIVKKKFKHDDQSLITNITDVQLEHPSEILPPLENAKKEAQYLFSKQSVEFLVETFQNLKFRHVICIGTPRIHEHIRSSNKNLSSILLDIDARFHNFFGPLEFCWYNLFNNHFFFDEARDVFRDFLKGTKGKDTVLISDPPFGGRVEPLAHTFSGINEQYKIINESKEDLPIFWIFPYFMEPQILNSVPNFHMLDYKVLYDNHPLFQNGTKGRKQGSPVRIFTNVNPSKIKLPASDYKFCQICNKGVSKENRHCYICGECTSKNGDTYTHCNVCQRCVKPSWQHCAKCQRCAQVGHRCCNIAFTGICLNCAEPGHKKKECPQVTERKKLTPTKRKLKLKVEKNKKQKS